MNPFLILSNVYKHFLQLLFFRFCASTFITPIRDPVDFERVRITVLLHCSLNLFHRHQSIGAVTENDVVKSGICD